MEDCPDATTLCATACVCSTAAEWDVIRPRRAGLRRWLALWGSACYQQQSPWALAHHHMHLPLPFGPQRNPPLKRRDE